MMSAVTSVGAASGIRAWVGQRFGEVLTPRRGQRITIVLFAAPIVAPRLFVSGSGPAGTRRPARARRSSGSPDRQKGEVRQPHLARLAA